MVEKIKEMLGRISIDDVDRDEDLIWAISELVNIEKHLYMVISHVKDEKLKNLALQLLKQVREERTKHLERVYFLKEFGFWCIFKHIIGGMHQFAEVLAKDNHMLIEKENLLKTTNDAKQKKKLTEEIKKDKENIEKDIQTISFLHDLLILLRKFKSYTKQ